MASGPEPFGLEPSGSLGPVPLPTRSLGVVALVLFVLFATVVAGALWPIQLLDPLWQLKLSAALLNAAAFTLQGLALLQLACFLDQDDPLSGATPPPRLPASRAPNAGLPPSGRWWPPPAAAPS